MKLNSYYLLALVPFGAAAFSGSVGMHLGVLGVALGIFFGTLSMRSNATGDPSSTSSGA